MLSNESTEDLNLDFHARNIWTIIGTISAVSIFTSVNDTYELLVTKKLVLEDAHALLAGLQALRACRTVNVPGGSANLDDAYRSVRCMR